MERVVRANFAHRLRHESARIFGVRAFLARREGFAVSLSVCGVVASVTVGAGARRGAARAGEAGRRTIGLLTTLSVNDFAVSLSVCGVVANVTFFAGARRGAARAGEAGRRIELGTTRSV